MSANLDAAPPMAGAPLTGYDVLSSTPGEAMKKPSRAGGAKTSKARSRRSPRLKRNIESKESRRTRVAFEVAGEATLPRRLAKPREPDFSGSGSVLVFRSRHYKRPEGSERARKGAFFSERVI